MGEGLVPLDTIGVDGEAQILPDFPALVGGRRMWVTAVLERTAVLEPAPGEPKILVGRHHCLVDPGRIRYGMMSSRDAARRGREAARRNRGARHAA